MKARRVLYRERTWAPLWGWLAIRKRIWYKDIVSVRPVTYRPFRDFGGWGIKWRGKRTAWTIRGHQAVAVKLHSGRQIYVGSMYPQRLAARIEAAGGPGTHSREHRKR